MKNLSYQKPEIKEPDDKNQADACYLEITYNCNLKCQFCYNEKKICRPSLAKLLRILKILKKNGILEIRFTGGEFFTFRPWPKLLEKAEAMGFLTGIISNGTLISRVSSDILKKFQSAGVSFHSSDPGIYEKITGVKGSFASLIQGLNKLKENNVAIGLCYTITEDNYFRIYSDIKELIYKYQIPVKTISFNRLIKVGSAKSNWDKISKIDYQKAFDEAEKIRNEFKIQSGMHPFPLCSFPEKEHDWIKGCGAGRNYIVVDWQGNVRFCPQDSRIAGNLFSRSFKEIFKSEFWENLRQNKWLPEQCQNCKLFESKCSGGCYIASPQKNDYNFIPDPLLIS